ncbi:hypothetical protein O7623_00920 [Solwaraspora sp. WMMD791]|uniref:hypothetical protein n=1 Tax=Solwaraspora sp. WMMD791 TaxID=3016086 RepID=UPI00249AA006|nr:hypothetical protein [Solwaraspora sp. WMMD791]WFE27808.1 hypothetical protein O7623_00920 [Solwaraspora sp. WMMD791]
MTDAPTATRIPRRAVMAALLLTGAPNTIRDLGDGKLSVDFDTIADLRAWLTAAGLDTPGQPIEHQGTLTDGRPYRSLAAWPTWHGWKISAHAMEHPTTTPLDTDTTTALTALAGVTS